MGRKRIVSQEWVKQSLTPYIEADEDYQYGYKWWLYGRRDAKSFVWTCRGFGGQGLKVFPQEKLLVVVTGWEILKDEMSGKTLVDHLLAAVKSHECDSGKN